MKTSKYILHSLLIGIIVFTACSTEKDAFINRSYHNMTAHYNGYWNANEIIDLTMMDFEKSFVENYDDILPVFQYPDEAESKNFKSPMDTAIKKCEIVINKNQMPNKKVGQYRNTEWCSWIDDNWLVIGQSQFYKREFDNAMQKFTFIEKAYKTEAIIYNAMLWQSKVLIEQEDYIAAQSILDELINKQEEQAEEAEKAAEAAKKAKARAKRNGTKKRKKSSSSKKEEKPPAQFPEKLLEDVWPVYADLYLRKGEYDKAKEALEKSIELARDRQFKTRLIFILAQLNHKQGAPAASEQYAEVVKRNPKYDMAFNAKINKAISFSGSDKGSVKSELRKMLRDEKNIDYFDQIYYTLGNIEIAEGDRELGIQDLEASIRTSKSNTAQKSKSFLTLGKIFYEDKQYVKAQQYYDSTLKVLDVKHPEYDFIAEQNISLTELVKNLNLAQNQDSLMSLCLLTDSQLEKKVQGLIEAEEARIREEEEQAAQLALQPVAIGGNLSGNGKFWAFNSKIRDKGFNDFKDVWGARRNEDNWRRSEAGNSFAEESEDPEDSNKNVNPKLTVDYYKKDLPCANPKKEEQARQDIVTGYYNAATIYRNELKDNDAAIKTFKKLDPYLPHPKAIESLYQLYVINGILNNSSEELNYKNRILNDYPKSDFAKLINNPNFQEELLAAEANEEQNYELAYSAYQTGLYDKSIGIINERLKVKDNPLACKYYYLKAMAISKTNKNPSDLSAVEKALDELVKNCDDEVMVQNAVATLDILRNTQSQTDALNGTSKYIYNSKDRHVFVLIFPNDAGSVNQAKTKVSNLNLTAFSTKNLELKSSFIDADNQMISVRSFKNKEAALDYYLTFQVNKKEVKSLQQFDYFVITDKNFSTLFLDKDVAEYLEFFQKNYLDQ